MSEDYTPSMESLKKAHIGLRRRDLLTVSSGLPGPELLNEWAQEFDRAIAAHDAELREQIARDIEARKPRASKLSEYVTGVRRGIYLAARIARGKAS